jgi:hypothetical protein
MDGEDDRISNILVTRYELGLEFTECGSIATERSAVSNEYRHRSSN